VSGTSRVGAGPVPGDLLLHPAPLGTAAVIVFNDLWLKVHWAGWVSGKLSDLAICFLLPVTLAAAVEWMAWTAHRPWRAGASVRWGACALAAAYFTALQLSPVAARIHVAVLEAVVPGTRFAVTPDPTDLVALLAIPLAWCYLATRRSTFPR